MNLAQRLEESLARPLFDLITQASRVAAAQGIPLYLVGGAVRDLLMGQPLLDLDLVVEGEAPLLAPALAKEMGGTVTSLSQFGTAKVQVEDVTLDLATARKESYPRPGALPLVQPGSILDDLARRDFTINAMALSLGSSNFGQLLDPHNGTADIDGGLVRVLHSASFRDDPTRILRAVRYEQRLGFHLEATTERLLREALPFLIDISGDRIRHELERILLEESPADYLARAENLGVLQAVCPALRWTERAHRASRLLHKGKKASQPLMYLALLAYEMEEADMSGLVQRLNMPSRWAACVRDTAALKAMMPRLSNGMAPSRGYELLRALTIEAVMAVATVAPPAPGQVLQEFAQRSRYVRPALKGQDLLAMGVPQGPPVGQLLQELRAARLDGLVASREEEVALVQRSLALLSTQAPLPRSRGPDDP
ncbi:MAG: CCA tRNA nucleotidyltransferase [Chloroflexi bacterium]|nr:CCA tRNA nucleotidyltransferase [Chloroflexota bacterium]